MKIKIKLLGNVYKIKKKVWQEIYDIVSHQYYIYYMQGKIKLCLIDSCMTKSFKEYLETGILHYYLDNEIVLSELKVKGFKVK